MYIYTNYLGMVYTNYLCTMGISPAAEPLPDLVPRLHSGTGQHGIGRDQLQRVHLRSGSLREASLGDGEIPWEIGFFGAGESMFNPQN